VCIIIIIIIAAICILVSHHIASSLVHETGLDLVTKFYHVACRVVSIIIIIIIITIIIIIIMPITAVARSKAYDGLARTLGSRLESLLRHVCMYVCMS
jgi:hypothetical protein